MINQSQSHDWFINRRRKGGGSRPTNNLRGGQHTLCPPPPPRPTPQYSTHIFLQFLFETGKNHKCSKLKGKIIINVTLIWFEGTCKTIPFNSILECSIFSDFKMRNVIIWHWFIKNKVGTWRRNDVMCLLEFCPFGPPYILNLATPPPPIF